MGKVSPLRRPRKRGRAPQARTSNAGFALLLAACFLGTFTAVFLWGGVGERPAAATLRGTPVEVHFGPCSGPVRTTCVVDGDTIWVAGAKIRMADYNTPETGSPDCEYERRLGERATARLVTLLNGGKVTIGANPEGRDYDTYGRQLRVVRVDGTSVGDTLIAEGLAEPWRGHRRYWC